MPAAQTDHVILTPRCIVAHWEKAFSSQETVAAHDKNARKAWLPQWIQISHTFDMQAFLRASSFLRERSNANLACCVKSVCLPAHVCDGAFGAGPCIGALISAMILEDALTCSANYVKQAYGENAYSCVPKACLLQSQCMPMLCPAIPLVYFLAACTPRTRLPARQCKRMLE